MLLDKITTLPKTLNWDIVAVQATNPLTGQPLFYNDKKTTHYDLNTGAGGALEPVKAMQLFRSDNGELIECVPSSYAHIPNKHFVEFVEGFANDNPNFEFQGYQETLGGRRIYAFFKTESEYEINNTAVHTFLVIKTSHDQSSAFELYCYQVELICTNGMMRTVKSKVMKPIVHSGAAAFKVKSLKMDQQHWLKAEQVEADRRQALTQLPINNAITWAYAAYVNNHNPVTFFGEFASNGIGNDGVSSRSFNTISKIQSDVVTTIKERSDARNAASLESGLTRYFTHTNSVNSKNMPLPMAKLVERFNGNYKGMMDRSDKFMELLTKPSVVSAYNALPTP